MCDLYVVEGSGWEPRSLWGLIVMCASSGADFDLQPRRVSLL